MKMDNFWTSDWIYKTLRQYRQHESHFAVLLSSPQISVSPYIHPTLGWYFVHLLRITIL